MNTNGSSSRHWFRVFRHFGIDVLAFIASFVAGMWIRFGNEWLDALAGYWPGVVVGGLVFACATYTFGLYALHSASHGLLQRALFLALGCAIAFILMLGIFYLNFSTRIGRGAMLISAVVTYLTVLAHHALLLHRFRNYRERVALVVTSATDESELPLLRAFGGHYLNLVGVVHYDNYQPGGQTRVLGRVSQLHEIAARENLERVLCTNQCISDPALCKTFCQLRYSGVTVMPLISLFEEMAQCVPVELISPEWLLSASGSAHMFYIKKLKRGFDIAASITGLLFFWPFLLFGILVVKLTAPNGPVFFRQTRCGRFGRPFELIKLRTMRVDAENGEAVWASARDPRTFPGGNILRKYRIDEIPQLLNVLRGEMSCVGPRPERPEFASKLSERIPYYQERFMVQPGLTGWAQVNYPYGASVEDAKRKLEYDLYYTKNMCLFLDLFILLDTVRIVARGGLKKSHQPAFPHYRGDTDWIPAVSETARALVKESTAHAPSH